VSAAEPLARIGRRAATRATSGPVDVSALPVTVNLKLYEGDDFTLALIVSNPDDTPADLTGCTPLAQIRATPGDIDPIAVFVASVAGDTVNLHLAGADSATLTAAAVWDCQITDTAGYVTTLAAGTIAVTAEVSR
jgi:hypothetical protein